MKKEQIMKAILFVIHVNRAYFKSCVKLYAAFSGQACMQFQAAATHHSPTQTTANTTLVMVYGLFLIK
jgi:hypothetical protein